MKKQSKRRSALLMSFASLLLCFAMLVSTTFAWFTDSVTSGVNTIQAGNLDVEVSYNDNGTWKSIQDATSLFSKGLWEPGHTEFVTLKVENRGTLALNYKMLVSPVSENGGVNKAGESFKLSDYLMFGTTAASTTEPTYTRETARAAATNSGLLNQSNLNWSNTMAAGAEEYITLVIYMPENVGNEANYLTGTVAPQINLGITVLATQHTVEVDSFDANYDAGAVDSNYNGVGPVYNSFVQSIASQPIPENNTEPVTVTASGKLNKGDATTTKLAEVEVPAAAIAEGAEEITVSVTPVAATNENAQTAIQTESGNGREAVNFDIHVDGIKEGASINVTVFIGKGLSNVTAYHNGETIVGATYEASTGYISFSTTSFSDYTFAYDPAVAAVGSQTYGSVANAFAAVKSGETITLLKNCAGGGIIVPSGSNFTVDFNGYTYTVNETPLAGSNGTKTQAFQLLKDSTLIFKNGNIVADNADVRMMIQNYSDLTLNNMNLDATVGTNGIKYVLSNNNGEIVINNTKITPKSTGIAFDAYYWPSGGYEDVSVTVNGNSIINGMIEVDGEGEDFLSHLTVKKLGTATVTAPNGYTWNESGELVEVSPFQIGTTGYNTLAEAVSAAEAGDTVQIMNAGTYKLQTLSKNITIKGGVDGVVFDCVGSGSIASVPNGATFENVKFKMGSSNYHGFQHAGPITMKDCVIEGLFFSYGDMNFNGCTFNQTASEYAMWLYSGNVTFKDCEFNCNGKFLNVYNEGNNKDNGSWKISAEGCTFNSTKANKAAFNVKETCGAKVLKYTVNISNCTTNENFPVKSGDANSALLIIDPLVQVDDRTGASIGNTGISITLDGEKVY